MNYQEAIKRAKSDAKMMEMSYTVELLGGCFHSYHAGTLATVSGESHTLCAIVDPNGKVHEREFDSANLSLGVLS
jgi:hypothetical protein